MKKDDTYTIGVVTYHARFDEYLKPLIRNLTRIFPDREILCVINGHPDQTLQIQYLDNVTRFLRQFKNVRYLAHAQMQPLSKSWNQLIILSPTNKIAILSDDVYVGDFFREELEKHVGKHEMFLMNRTWCHFVISKATVRKVGWFEERYPGIGWEDTDYTFRMVMANVPCPSEKVRGILNLSTDNDNNPGWENPENRKMKYTSANEDYFLKKWLVESYDGPDHTFTHTSGGPHGQFALKPGMETPDFYDTTVLTIREADTTSAAAYRQSSVRYVVQKTLFVTVDVIVTFLRKIKRFLKKVRETRLPI